MTEIQVPFFRPSIGPAEEAAVLAVLRSGWLTQGPAVQAFEAAFATAVGAEHAIAVNSCTAALHLALLANGIGPGDEVLVPTMTFAATAQVVTHVGAQPVLVDVDPGTLTIDLASARDHVTPATRAIMPVHFAGQPADLDGIAALADDFDLVVVEDAAHALPSSYRGRTIGSTGNPTCFSFYANKTLTTGEGGMLTTDSGATAELVGELRLHGMSRDGWKRHRTESTWDYDIVRPGWKYNLTDLAAAIGLVQLQRMDELAEKRTGVVEQYRAALDGVDGVVPLEVASTTTRHAWHLFVVGIDIEEPSIHPTIADLREQGIGANVHYKPLHLHPQFRELPGVAHDEFPGAMGAFRRNVTLPLYPDMTSAEVDRVVSVLGALVARHRAA